VKLLKGKIRQKIKLITGWVFISGILSFYYSNCESYSSNTISSALPVATNTQNANSCDLTPNSSECIKAQVENYELHKGFIYLTIAGSNTIQMNAYDNAVNVSGNCYQDIFKKTEIYYRLVNDAQNAFILSNNPTKSYVGSTIQCVNGQWGFSIYFNPGDVTYVGTTTPFQKSQSHTLIVEMIVRDENNTLYQNTSTALDSIGFAPSIITQ
jgi:hypothetical protein